MNAGSGTVGGASDASLPFKVYEAREAFEAFEPPSRIAVFRALQLGDMLCIVPALRALRAAAPRSRITLIGLPWAREFAGRFAAYIDDFLAFPGYPGLPEREPALQALPGFIAVAQLRRFGLALQMHGSGTLTNPLTCALGAERNAGFFEPGDFCPDPQRFLAWNEREHEVLRYLRLMAALGIPAQGTGLEFPLSERDFQELARSGIPPLSPGTYVCIHPGSRMASRRWLPERFAGLADRLADAGLRVVLTGSAQEARLTAEVLGHMRGAALDLAGKTGLGALAALVAGARMVVCNDTGMSHVAAAVATPSIVISSGSDPGRWAPLDSARHRLLFEPAPCRPCMHVECPYASHPCARLVTLEEVWRETRGLLAAFGAAQREGGPTALDAAGSTVAQPAPSPADAVRP